MHSAGQPVDLTAGDELLHPSYWLVSGLEWQGNGAMAEAAVAVAPQMIQRDALSRDANQVLACADLYARRRGQRVIFFSDLTRMFTVAGTSWSQLGVDWQNALLELRDGTFPAMFLTISQRAHVFVCNPTSRLLPITPTDAEDAGDDELELVRQTITAQLATDWPPYMQSIIDAGRVSVAG